jgi:16S rRNA (uracil1498-N3)-methyltransferase
MPKFFTTQISNGVAVIDGPDAAHITGPLRLRPGDALTVGDLAGWDYRCVITTATPGQVTLAVEERAPCQSEPKTLIRLYQALPKGDKLETIVQKATELGVGEIYPILTSRCISRPDAKSMEKKRARLDKIALEAAKQSGRGRIPLIGMPRSFEEAIEHMKSSALPLFFYEQADTPLRGLMRPDAQSIAILIGSEGGFSPEEAAYAEANGVPAVSLGHRILRCETAPLAAISAILYAVGDM